MTNEEREGLLSLIDQEIAREQVKLRSYDEDPYPWDEMIIKATTGGLSRARSLVVRFCWHEDTVDSLVS